MEKRKRRHFPDEFKRQAVARVETSGLPLFEVAAELGVHESQLRRWSRQFGQTTALTTRRRPSRETPGLSPADPRRDAAADRDNAHLRSGHAMKFAFVDEHRGRWPMRMMCSVLGVSVSGDYAWRSRPESPRSLENRALLRIIRLVHAESGGSYGAPRVHAALRAAGHSAGRHRIARLMRRSGLRGLAAIPRKVRTTDSRH